MKLDRAGKGMEHVVKKGWDDAAGKNESSSELLKDAIFALRRDIGAVRHQFEEDDGSIREPDPKVVIGDVAEAKRSWTKMVENFRAEKTMLYDALVHVEYEVLPKQEAPDIQYLNQVGGPYNYVAFLVAKRLGEVVTSAEQLREFQRNFMPMFFHVSGWEGFERDAQKRLAQSTGE